MAVTIATLGERALRRLGVTIVREADRPALTVQVPRAAIATAALVELGVIASDETPSVADQNLALAKLASVQAALTAQAYVSWADAEVPQAAAEEYVKLTALVMAPAFGKAAGDAALHAALEARVRKVAVVMGAPDLATEAVMNVHRDLTARGVARWTVFDVPDAVEAPYVLLAANQLAPQFGAQADPRDVVQAMRSLAQYVALPTSGEQVVGAYF